MVQEREYVRVMATLPVLVNIVNRNVQIQGHTVDVSGEGLLVAGMDTLALGEQVQFSLRTDPEQTTPENPPIVGAGTVVRVDEPGYRAIRFDSIKDVNRRRLIRFAFERQRTYLQRGLGRGRS